MFMAVMKTMKMAEMMTIILAVATVAKLTTGFRKTSTTVPFELDSLDPTLGGVFDEHVICGVILVAAAMVCFSR